MSNAAASTGADLSQNMITSPSGTRDGIHVQDYTNPQESGPSLDIMTSGLYQSPFLIDNRSLPRLK